MDSTRWHDVFIFGAVGWVCSLVLCSSSGCGVVAASDIVHPVYASAVQVCHVRQQEAVESADTREEAEEAVHEIRGRCDVVYSGLNVLSEMLEDHMEQE